MKFAPKYFPACFCLLLLCHRANAQMGISDNTIYYSTNGSTNIEDTNRLFVIREIYITGNNKTRPEIVLRELPFKLDEAYPIGVLADKFKKARRNLINTTLFRDVVVSLKSVNGYDVYVNIEVAEKWYIWPGASFRPVNKTLAEWWSQENRSMDRINYGLSFAHNNFTGRNDKMKVGFTNGYTRQVYLEYYGLRLDKDLKWSTNAGINIGKDNQINYQTENNRRLYLKNVDNLRNYVSGFFQLNYRPAIKTTHTFGIGYIYDNVADTVFKLNPSYFPSRSAIGYPEAFYRLVYFDVDFIRYPTKGFMGEVSLKKKGFGGAVNVWDLTTKASKIFPINDRYFFNLSGLAEIKLPFSQPYTAKQFIGYDSKYLQGYEYYIIDGVAGGYTKATLARSILKTHITIPSQRLKSLNFIPIKLYVKTFVNAGYIYNPRPGNNPFTNAMLYSAGVGIDLVTINDFVIKIEWSINRLGENGVYLH